MNSQNHVGTHSLNIPSFMGLVNWQLSSQQEAGKGPMVMQSSKMGCQSQHCHVIWFMSYQSYLYKIKLEYHHLQRFGELFKNLGAPLCACTMVSVWATHSNAVAHGLRHFNKTFLPRHWCRGQKASFCGDHFPCDSMSSYPILSKRVTISIRWSKQ